MASAIDYLGSSTRIQWLSNLNTEFTPTKNYRRTSIICTIGPKTNNVEALNKLRKAGLNVVRMNFSHGSYEYHQSVIDNTREAERVQKGRQVAIALGNSVHLVVKHWVLFSARATHLRAALVQITSEPAQSGIFTEWVHAAKTAAQISDGVCP